MTKEDEALESEYNAAVDNMINARDEQTRRKWMIEAQRLHFLRSKEWVEAEEIRKDLR